MLLRSAIVQYIQNIGIVSYFNPLLLVVSGYLSLTSQKDFAELVSKPLFRQLA
jgi:hypothetical protein